VRTAQLQFVQQVVPPVPGHHVEQQELAPHDARLVAGIGPRQGHNHVGGGHQLGNPVGEAERRDPRYSPGQLPEPSLDGLLAAGHGQHVHPGLGQRGHALHKRAKPPPAVDDQHAELARRDSERGPGLLLRRRGVERGPHRRRYDRYCRPGKVTTDRCRRGGRGHQEQVGSLPDPDPVHCHVGAQHDRPPGRRLGLEPGRCRGAGGEHAEHEIRGLPLQVSPQRWHQPCAGRLVHETCQTATSAQVGEMHPVV
jgi:hypothetical protein